MRKLLIGGIACLMLGGISHASGLEDNCGCGLGSMIFEGKDTLVAQVLAATTNGIFGNQTFGISSGTLGCEQPISFVSNERLNKFIAGNMDNLAKDIAMGNGESLDTLAEIMEIKDTQKGVFYTRLQANFSEIFAAESVQHQQVLAQIVDVYKTI